MNVRYYQTAANKRSKMDILNGNSRISKYILDTRSISIGNLADMLEKYAMVVFKPIIGGSVKDIGFVFNNGKEFYKVLQSGHSYYYNGVRSLYNYINAMSRKRELILQQGVNHISYQETPVVVRVIVQKVYNNWQVNGIVFKAINQGKALDDEQSIKSGYGYKTVFDSMGISLGEQSRLKSEIVSLCYHSAIALNKSYIGLRELGFDINVDKELMPKIIEVNTRPRYEIFKKMGEKTTYKRIDINHKAILRSVNNFKREES